MSKITTQQGFTLIELLVVITIIAVLASLLLPAIKLVQRSAYASKCSSNLHQAGLAMTCYADEYDSSLTPGYANATNWQALLTTYIAQSDPGKIMLCPAAALKKGTLHYSAQFSLIPNLNNAPPWRPKVGRLDELRADGVLLFDGSQDPTSGTADKLSTEQSSMWEFFGENAADDAKQPTLTAYNLSDITAFRTARFRHGANNRCTFLFGDMHTAVLANDQLTKGNLRCRRNGRKHGYETWIP